MEKPSQDDDKQHGKERDLISAGGGGPAGEGVQVTTTGRDTFANLTSPLELVTRFASGPTPASTTNTPNNNTNNTNSNNSHHDSLPHPDDDHSGMEGRSHAAALVDQDLLRFVENHAALDAALAEPPIFPPTDTATTSALRALDTEQQQQQQQQQQQASLTRGSDYVGGGGGDDDVDDESVRPTTTAPIAIVPGVYKCKEPGCGKQLRADTRLQHNLRVHYRYRHADKECPLVKGQWKPVENSNYIIGQGQHPSSSYSCPADDCGSVFQNTARLQQVLRKHYKRKHPSDEAPVVTKRGIATRQRKMLKSQASNGGETGVVPASDDVTGREFRVACPFRGCEKRLAATHVNRLLNNITQHYRYKHVGEPVPPLTSLDFPPAHATPSSVPLSFLCSNCSASSTTQWRFDQGKCRCNACGLYWLRYQREKAIPFPESALQLSEYRYASTAAGGPGRGEEEVGGNPPRIVQFPNDAFITHGLPVVPAAAEVVGDDDDDIGRESGGDDRNRPASPPSFDWTSGS